MINVHCSILGQRLPVTNIRELGECVKAGELVVYFVCNVCAPIKDCV